MSLTGFPVNPLKKGGPSITTQEIADDQVPECGRKPLVPGALVGLDCVTGELHKVVGRLVERLAPVCTQHPEKSCQPSNCEASGCAVADQVSAATMRVQLAIDALQALHNRLEV